MNFWIFDAVHFNTVSSKIEYSSSRKVWISRGDKILFFHRELGELVFKSTGIVENAIVEDLDESIYKFIGTISNIEAFTENRFLEDFVFSLEKIYRYQNPLIHFRRPYIKFSENDFQTINRGEIYWARTAFGLFINRLSRQQIVRFMRNLAESDPEVLLQQSDYKKAWMALRKFISEEFVAAANLMSKIKEQVEAVNKVSDIELDFSNIGLSTDEDESTTDFIKNQEKILSQFANLVFEDETQSDLLHEIDNKIEGSDHSDQTFDEIFRGTSWPIQMIVD